MILTESGKSPALIAKSNKKGLRPDIEWKKERIKKHLDAVRGKLSGAVAADNIAEDKISGKEKRVITSEIGAELAAEIRRRKATEK